MLSQSQREFCKLVGVSFEDDSNFGKIDFKKLSNSEFVKDIAVGRIINISEINHYDKNLRSELKRCLGLTTANLKVEIGSFCLNEFWLVTIVKSKSWSYNLNLKNVKDIPFKRCEYPDTFGKVQEFFYMITPIAEVVNDYDEWLTNYLTSYNPKFKVSSKYRKSCENLFFLERGEVAETAFRERLEEYDSTKPQSEIILNHITLQ